MTVYAYTPDGFDTEVNAMSRFDDQPNPNAPERLRPNDQYVRLTAKPGALRPGTCTSTADS
jgi:hypothetical protein